MYKEAIKLILIASSAFRDEYTNNSKNQILNHQR